MKYDNGSQTPSRWSTMHEGKGHDGSVPGQWRRKSGKGKPFFFITELSLETQPSTTWKSGKKNTNWVRSQGTGLLPADCRFWYEEPSSKRKGTSTVQRLLACQALRWTQNTRNSFNSQNHCCERQVLLIPTKGIHWGSEKVRNLPKETGQCVLSTIPGTSKEK